jgi:hypothetical protein
MKRSQIALLLVFAIALVGYMYIAKGRTNRHPQSSKQAIISLLVPAQSPTAPALQGKLPLADTLTLSANKFDTVGDMPDEELTDDADPITFLEEPYKNYYILMSKHAMPMFQRHDTLKVMRGMMSRCPSGYNYYVNEDSITFDSTRLGSIEHDIGCEQDWYCDFKLNLLTGVVWLKEHTSKEWLSIEEFERRHFGKAS